MKTTNHLSALFILLLAVSSSGCARRDSGSAQTAPVPFVDVPSPAITPENERITARAAMEEIAGRAYMLENMGGTPVIVYDLDATLFDNRQRTLAILQDILEDSAAQFTPEQSSLLSGIHVGDVRYRIDHTLAQVGFTDSLLTAMIYRAWGERFFTDEWVVLDEPIPGAVPFVNALHEMGVVTVYLTGRYTESMRQGSIQDLINHGFPVPDDSTIFLITKDDPRQPDVEYKQASIDRIRRMGAIVATFENEPRNNNLLAEAFPGSFHVFLDTAHSPGVVPLRGEIKVISDFVID